MSAALRILDASLNRAREALRVMEDAARFSLNDEALCGELKAVRHDLRRLIEQLPIRDGQLEANRDVESDVGTRVSTQAEMSRSSLLEIVIAAGKRLGESLRVIEEIAKTLDSTVAARFEALRYRAYTIEQKVQLRLGSGRARQWRLCVLLTQSLCRLPWDEVVRRGIDGGADCIQVREKDMAGGDLVQHAKSVIEIARPNGVSVIMNDRADVALAAGADGVHIGQRDLSLREVRCIAGRELIVGVSTHDLDEAEAAVDAGADYCGVGAMFASTLKPDREPAGRRYLQQFIKQFPEMPHLAIGGINASNIHALTEAGARGVAVSTAICAAEDPQHVCRVLCEALQPATVAKA